MPTIRKLLSRQLERQEVEIVLAVLRAEREGGRYQAGRLGLTQSLIDRGWLRRTADGNIAPSDETKSLVMESSRKS